jgi:mono/diheme cytochrome c family protein
VTQARRSSLVPQPKGLGTVLDWDEDPDKGARRMPRPPGEQDGMIRSALIRSVFLGALLVAFTLTFGVGCGRGEGGSSGTATSPTPAAAPAAPAAPAAIATNEPSAAARAEAKEIFASRCATCHGPEGMGNGPASAGLTPPPRNFHDPAFQARVTNEHVEQIIQYGGAGVGLSPAMPANPDLTSKPEVVAALREIIRSFGK